MVLGDVGDSGESERSDIPIERVSKDDVPDPARHSFFIMEGDMAKRKQPFEVKFPNAAGIDIGSSSHFVEG